MIIPGLLPVACRPFMMRAIFTFLFVSITGMAFTQNVFDAGSIEYERKTNIHKFNGDNEWFARMKDQVDKYHTAYYDLTFNAEKSIYKPGKEVPGQKLSWFAPPGADNNVYTDFKTNTVTQTKSVFENVMLINDSLRDIKWKITNEFRNILGYECRKAVGKIYDSLVVVAFYCDQIAVSTGPENISGLPGAILGMAIPRMYTTWFATKINKAAFNEVQVIEPPKKGKATTPEKMKEEIKTAVKDWGDYVNKILWFVLL